MWLIVLREEGLEMAAEVKHGRLPEYARGAEQTRVTGGWEETWGSAVSRERPAVGNFVD